MKSILISIRPEHVNQILLGNKTMELRKNIPRDFEGWVYIYVTKTGDYLVGDTVLDDYILLETKIYNGKIIARFRYDQWDWMEWLGQNGKWNKYDLEDEYKDKLCLTIDQIHEYGKGKDLFVWYIKDLEVFHPVDILELGDFATKHKDRFGDYFQRLKRPPQSWQYVYYSKGKEIVD